MSFSSTAFGSSCWWAGGISPLSLAVQISFISPSCLLLLERCSPPCLNSPFFSLSEFFWAWDCWRNNLWERARKTSRVHGLLWGNPRASCIVLCKQVFCLSVHQLFTRFTWQIVPIAPLPKVCSEFSGHIPLPRSRLRRQSGQLSCVAASH